MAKVGRLAIASEWPLIGREAELQRVAALLVAGARGVVLAGGPGVGKTRLANECVARAVRMGLISITAVATRAAASVPLGAFAGLLAGLTPGTDRTEMLRQVAASIAERGKGHRIGLLVDDAHLLDEASAALTLQIAAGTSSFVVVTVRSGEPAPDAVVALWKETLLERLELPPLDEQQVEALLSAVLGGPTDTATSRLVWKRTGGNVLFLRELLLSAVESGGLAEEEGVWRLRGSPSASARLVEIVNLRLVDLPGHDREALELLALGEPLGVDILRRAAPLASLETLERRGLVQVAREGRRLEARLAHPLYTDAIRAGVTPLRSRALNALLADVVESVGPRRGEDTLRVATCWLDGGGCVSPTLMLAAAQQARSRWALPLAERLARAAIDAGGSFEARFELGLVLSLAGRGDASEAILAELDAEAPTEGDRAKVAFQRIENFIFLGRIDRALRTAREAEAALSEPAARAMMAGWQVAQLLMLGEIAEARALADHLRTTAQGEALVLACTSSAFLFALAGRLSDALDVIERAHAAFLALPEARMQWAPSLIASVRGDALLLAGHLVPAEELVTEQYAKAVEEGSEFAQAYLGWRLAQCMLARGRVRTAARWGRVTAALLRQRVHDPGLKLALPTLAHALALGGCLDEASAVLAELEALSAWGAPGTEPEIIRAGAWRSIAGGDVSGGAAALVRAADVARCQGSFALESATLHDLVRLGKATDVATRLGELAEIVEGPLAPTRAAHATAVLARDPAALEAASCAFEEIGALLLAAEAAADAAVAWRTAGQPRKAAGCEHRGNMLADRCEGARTPGLTAVMARAALSPRELEIARLAAAGMTNKEIATRLCFSVRTVENKLHIVYEKLGVAGREELSHVLDAP